MIAVLRVVARHEQEVSNAEQRSAEQIRLDGDPIPVSRGDLDDGFEPSVDAADAPTAFGSTAMRARGDSVRLMASA